MGRAAGRIELLDALRGFAVFGILIANIPVFEGWAWIGEDQRVALAGPTITQIDDLVQSTFIEGKFYTIFSMLFGIGVTLQYRSFAQRSADPGGMIARRLLVLLGIGLFHLIFIWPGDILALYAVVGFVLIGAQQWPDRRLLWVALLLILAPIPLTMLTHASGIAGDFGLFGVAERASTTLGRPFRFDVDLVDFLASQDLMDRAAWQAGGFFVRIGDLLNQWRPLKVLGVMLIGVWVGRQLISGLLPGDRVLLRWVAILGIGTGLPLNFIYTTTGGMYAGSYGEFLPAVIIYAFAVVPLGLGYAAAFALLWPKLGARLGGLAAVGKMALTSYLTHSVIGMLLFSGFGLGLAGTLPPPWLYLLAVVIFAAQIPFSRWWLARYEQGPVEALWRRLAFGRMRAAPSPAPIS